MTPDIHRKAVIYCRVSDTKQTIRGSGLDSQQTRAQMFADYRGWDVVEVFKDDYTGASGERPAMRAMLKFLRKQKEGHYVIVDDLSRIARDIEVHIQLKRSIRSAGGTLVSPSFEFSETSDGRYMENSIANNNQWAREKNAEQTLNRMQSRVINGYWVFQPPVGYCYKLVTGRGKMLVRDEPLASIVTEALEAFASGRLTSVSEVKRWLENNPRFHPGRNGLITHERVQQMLTQHIYAGYISVPRWKISLRKGQHEPLIDLATYERIQDRLSAKSHAAARVDLHESFPLRGALACSDCEHPMTANYSKGQSKSYAYYLCRQPSCPSSGKSIARSKIEDAFAVLLRGLTPSRELIELGSALFKNAWDSQTARVTDAKKILKADLLKAEREIELMLDRVVQAESLSVIKAYERKIEDLERKKLAIKEKIAKCGAPVRSYAESFRTAMEFLANPWKLWESNRIEDKIACLKLTFAGHLVYDRESGFRTPKTTLPFKILSDFIPSEGEMARPAGFEPATFSLEG